MLLVIKKQHTTDTTFDNRKNGALIRAMRQQHPDVKITEENDGYCQDAQGNRYHFDNTDQTGYSRTSFQKLKFNQLKEISIRLTPG